VFKIKKPVDFSFLDYSTPERRKRFCEKEVELNRRFSPEVYRGVRPVMRDSDGAWVVDGDGDPVEHAVWMKRLPEEAMLAHRLERGDVEPAEMEALAEVLARFYVSEATTPEITAFGRPEQVEENTVENFDTTMDFGEDLLPDAVRVRLRSANERFLAERRDLFLARMEAGRILDGHGDLKPENIFLTADGPVVTDCIEFNDRFRYGDVLVDVGYLTMGLRMAGRADLRDVFLARFAERYEPDYPADLLAYYETYRAVVKGKIEGYRSRQPEVPEAERRAAGETALAHFRLAERVAPLSS
jgi:aminoglycoside phosphotransferase family enzyme